MIEFRNDIVRGKVDKKQKVYDKLNELNIIYEIINHEAVNTIEDIEKLGIFDKYEIPKNLFLRDDKGTEHFLVVLRKDKKADLRNLRAQIGSRHLSFASEQRLNKYLGLEKGSVSPMGIINDVQAQVKVIIDKDLRGKDSLGVHPNDNTSTIIISFDDLIRVIENNGNRIIYADI